MDKNPKPSEDKVLRLAIGLAALALLIYYLIETFMR
jgi:hypothetical protein